MTDTWRTLPGDADEPDWYAAWARAVVERDAARDAIRRVRAVVGPMHEDWCRGKHDAQRECECIRAEVLAALAGDA